MSAVEIRAVLDEAHAYIADAVGLLTSTLGETHPTVVTGRRVMASFEAIPADAVLVTEETLAAAFHRAWPYRRNTPTGSALSAAVLLAALRAEP